MNKLRKLNKDSNIEIAKIENILNQKQGLQIVITPRVFLFHK